MNNPRKAGAKSTDTKNRKKFIYTKGSTVTLSFALALVSVAVPGNFYTGQAQTRSLKVRYNPPAAPQNPGEPRGRGRGGGSRGPCKNYEGLTALVPVTKTQTKEYIWGQTTSQHPTFWFYLPQELSAGMPVEFVLQDEADNYIYKTNFKAPKTASGVISISVPPTATPMKVGKSYRSVLAIYCDPQRPSANVSVRSSVQRVTVPTSVQRQLAAAKTPLERAALYAGNGYWYDALTTLGEQRQRDRVKDTAIVAAWTELLAQANLQEAANADIVPCCKL